MLELSILAWRTYFLNLKWNAHEERNTSDNLHSSLFLFWWVGFLYLTISWCDIQWIFAVSWTRPKFILFAKKCFSFSNMSCVMKHCHSGMYPNRVAETTETSTLARLQCIYSCYLDELILCLFQLKWTLHVETRAGLWPNHATARTVILQVDPCRPDNGWR